MYDLYAVRKYRLRSVLAGLPAEVGSIVRQKYGRPTLYSRAANHGFVRLRFRPKQLS